MESAADGLGLVEGPAAGQVEVDCQGEGLPGGLEEKWTDEREVTRGDNPDVDGLATV